MIGYVYDDGGRKEAGYTGITGDCSVRAVSIALQLPYKTVYEELFERQRHWIATSKSNKAKELRSRKTDRSSPRNGVYTAVFRPYMAEKGWTWVPTMKIGSGTTVHLRSNELPSGRIVATLANHWCAVVDGVVHDIYDPSKDGTRAVYGYFINEAASA